MSLTTKYFRECEDQIRNILNKGHPVVRCKGLRLVYDKFGGFLITFELVQGFNLLKFETISRKRLSGDLNFKNNAFYQKSCFFFWRGICIPRMIVPPAESKFGRGHATNPSFGA